MINTREFVDQYEDTYFADVAAFSAELRFSVSSSVCRVYNDTACTQRWIDNRNNQRQLSSALVNLLNRMLISAAESCAPTRISEHAIDVVLIVAAAAVRGKTPVYCDCSLELCERVLSHSATSRVAIVSRSDWTMFIAQCYGARGQVFS